MRSTKLLNCWKATSRRVIAAGMADRGKGSLGEFVPLIAVAG